MTETQLSPGDLLDMREREIACRGLTSFPADSLDDTRRIEGIAAVLSCTDRPIRIALPKANLVAEFSPDLPAQLLYYLSIGDYEQADLEIAEQYVRQGDCVLEVGGGIGLTGCALARASGARTVVVEANPMLWASIEANFRANGLEVLLVKAAATPDHAQVCTAGRVQFRVASNYWWSSLVGASHMGSASSPLSGADDLISAQAVRLSDLLAEHRPSVLVMDVEGAEVDFFETALPDHVRAVFIEIHTPQIGSQATAALVARLQSAGFILRDVRAWTWVFERPARRLTPRPELAGEPFKSQQEAS